MTQIEINLDQLVKDKNLVVAMSHSQGSHKLLSIIYILFYCLMIGMENTTLAQVIYLFIYF